MVLKIEPQLVAVEMAKTAEVPTAIISVTSKDSDDVQFANNPNIRAIFRMKFDDIDIGEEELTERPVAKQEDLAGLKAFVDSLAGLDIDTLIVHCGSGISRSGATGAAIDEYLGLRNDIWRKRPYFPNLHVYILACKELGIVRTEEDIDRLFWLRHEYSMWSDAELLPLYRRYRGMPEEE